jgi:hypothetical protein
MATKKKTRKKSTKSKRTVGKKTASVKTAKRPKKIAKKKSAPKKAQKKKSPAKKQTRKKSGRTGALSFSARGPSRSGEQSGDLQGLSRLEAADSESVDELLEEGNAFEADVVAGVESADDADEKEVHTHEVPEDDVPEEYLDKE